MKIALIIYGVTVLLAFIGIGIQKAYLNSIRNEFVRIKPFNKKLHIIYYTQMFICSLLPLFNLLYFVAGITYSVDKARRAYEDSDDFDIAV